MTTTPAEDKRASIEANRKRYEALKAAAKTNTPKMLPERTGLGESPIPVSSVIHNESIPGGWYWTTELKRGEALRLINVSGTSSVSLLAWSKDEPSERLNHADTVKVQWSAAIQKGRMLLSDMGRVLLSVMEDTSFAHDALAGGSNAASNLAKYGPGSYRNTRDNFILAAGKLGLTRRDIPPCITFFAPLSTNEAGQFVWEDVKRRAGDFVDLRAEMDLFIAVSNCPHPLDPHSEYAPGAVEAVRFHARPSGLNDVARSASEEALRAFENTNALPRT